MKPATRRILWWIVIPAVAILATRRVAHGVDVHLEQAHRREFLVALGVPPTRRAIETEAATEWAAHDEIVQHVPIGSDESAVDAYARLLGADLPSHASDALGRPPMRLVIHFDEHVRWYELGVCDWDRGVAFTLDTARTVRDVKPFRLGACL